MGTLNSNGRAIAILGLILAVAHPAEAGCRPRLSRDGQEGRRLLLQADWEGARAAFQRAVDRGHASSAELLGLGIACFRAKNYRDAAKAYQRLIRLRPRVAEYRINLGLAYGYQQ